MSESVSILIKADDQASKTFAESARNIAASEKKVEQVLRSIESPIDRYNKELAELQALQKAGSLNADQFAAAQAKIKEKLDGTGNAYKEVGGKAKATSEFVGVLASISGSPEIAGLAGQLGAVTEKVGAFSEVSKAGGAGALAFKAGLVGLVGTVAVGLGKALGDVIFQTEKFTRELERAKVSAQELDAAIAGMRAKEFGKQLQDVELIRDPEAKQALYKQLLDSVGRDISSLSVNIAENTKLTEEWEGYIGSAWKMASNVVGDGLAEIAAAKKEELEIDKERMKSLKEQQTQLIELTSVRAQQNAMIERENSAKESSEAYLQNLRDELQYLKATREEQIQIEALRNTTFADNGRAEALLRERDAILAQRDAETKLAEQRKQAADERKQAVQLAAQEFENEAKRIDAIVKAERDRLQLRQIEVEQGKEAAKVQALMNQGVNAATAKELAAKEAKLDALNKKEAEPTRQKSIEASPLSAVEGRLISRGPAQSLQQLTLEELRQIRIDARNAARDRRDAERDALAAERNKVNVVVADAPT